MFRRFFRWNKAICFRIEQHLPHRKVPFLQRYFDVMADYVNRKQDAVVLDVGGGTKCEFASLRKPENRVKIIGIDLSEEALKKNNDIDERVVGNVEEKLPFAPNSIDLVTSRMVLEHLRDNGKFLEMAFTIVKPGGRLIHILPAKYALFSMINQLLPVKLRRKTLFFFFPENVLTGFPVYYDRCSYAKMMKLLHEKGFEVELFEVGYYQSNYFGFFIPFYIISVIYELVLYKLSIRDLSAYLLFVQRNPKP